MFTQCVAEDPDRSRKILEQLCQTYWKPVYAYIRRSGRGPEDGEDLTQAFFAHLLENGTFLRIDRSKGRFRSFLLTACSNFLKNDWRRRTSWKRGGGIIPLSLEGLSEDGFQDKEPADTLSPDQLFDRHWALALIDTAVDHLRREYEKADKARLFKHLRPYLLEDGMPVGEAAAELGMTEGSVKVTVHRLRRKLGHLLRGEISRTVESPEEIETELRHLIDALRTTRDRPIL
ncbi:MAG: sigma-70 family RNA polymerase sigma factor [Akkermansiaceae bacterium]|nr:sigma-70 family RNA polymerase sigma factor [Akkermansiaceae bacterium]